MNLMKYWPTSEEIDHCIKPEAEGAHDAVLLAAHQPSPLSYRNRGGEKVATTEDELYRYFITPDLPMGTHVVPVTGASGAGKSHLVRMLAARLQSEDSTGKFVVIRIPKSASLRTVVELILAPLPDESYAEVKREFKKAMASVDIASAVISFQAQLEIALQERAVELHQELKATPTQALKDKLGHAQKLPKFIGDPVIVEHFRTTVFPRIVKRAVAGHQAAASVDPLDDFTVADFDLPASLELGKAAASTQHYYQSVLRTGGGARLRSAVDLLNDRVVDQAVGRLFQLHEAIGGMTLQDVIIEIRRLLLRDGRELVILVEDFKALTGIQDTLAHVLIWEGVRDGKRELANMRSAIAVTDGYLDGQDTIATRAKREWIVESHLGSDAEVLQRTRRLVASYLNAARWGHAELARRYEKRGRNWSGEEGWIDPFVDHETESSDELAAFGNIDGVSLFPFSELAIDRLARIALTQADRLVFNPRFVIDHVLRNLLLVGRDAYGNGLFPPPSLLAPAPSAEVAQWLAALAVSDEQRQRYSKLVTIWGDMPATRAEIGRIAPKVFAAFGLEPPGIARVEPAQPEKIVPGAGTTTVAPPPRPPVENNLVTELRATLENWVQNNDRLEQGVANQIRKALEQAISERIGWNAERCGKFSIGSSRISIPNAAGEGIIRADAIKLAADNRDPDGRLRTDLVALLRYYQFNKRQADYDEVDDDLARIGNLVARLMPQALAIVRAASRVALQNASKLVATNSRLLGVLERGRTPAGLSAFLFGRPQLPDAPAEGAPLPIAEWRQLQDSARSVREKLKDLLLERSGCFQGAARTAYAVDIARIVEYYEADGEKPDLDVFETLDPAVRSVLLTMREAAVSVRAKRVQAEAQRLGQALNDELGDSFDKNQVADTLKELADGMQGMWVTDDLGMGVAAFKRLCDDFRGSALKEALATLQASLQREDEKNDGKGLTRIAQLDVNPLILGHRFVVTARKVTTAARRSADVRHGQTQGLDLEAQANEIRATFENLLGDLDALEAKGAQECC
jgi:energy-coupling factor transporter ATP-binding protein EcfA2